MAQLLPSSVMKKLAWPISTLAICVVVFAIMLGFQVNLQWFWILLYAAIIVPLSPFVVDPRLYYRGGLEDTATGFRATILLAASASISWVFAKSILNSSTLSATFGIVGGVAYAAYYTAFASVAIVVYFLRIRGYRSLPEAINERYGTLATVSFGLAVLFRLFQEVWSNSLVVAGFYGSVHSSEWWLAACLSTLVPVVYSISGGMRASIFTDVLQSAGAIGLLIAVLVLVGLNNPAGFGSWNPAGTCAIPNANSLDQGMCAQLGSALLGGNTTAAAAKLQYMFTPASCSYPTISNQSLCTAVGGVATPQSCALENQPVCAANGGAWTARSMWSLSGGVDLLIVALLQGILSYPFFDPVLTDRAFLAHPKTMVKAFFLGGLVAAAFILLFGFLGIFGSMEAILNPKRIPDALYAGTLGGQPAAVARYFGTAFFSVVNLIFITESLSTLDSTFTSVAKLMGPEFLGIVEEGKPRPPQSTTHRQLLLGRVVIVVVAGLGLLPLLANPTALDATTISGTIIMGLGPPVFALMWIDGYRPLTFHVPFWWGVGMGVVYQLSTAECCKNKINTTGFAIGHGSYSVLLGFNVIGAGAAWALMLITLLENPSKGPDGSGRGLVGRMRRILGLPPRKNPDVEIARGDSIPPLKHNPAAYEVPGGEHDSPAEADHRQ